MVCRLSGRRIRNDRKEGFVRYEGSMNLRAERGGFLSVYDIYERMTMKSMNIMRAYSFIDVCLW